MNTNMKVNRNCHQNPKHSKTNNNNTNTNSLTKSVIETNITKLIVIEIRTEIWNGEDRNKLLIGTLVISMRVIHHIEIMPTIEMYRIG